MAEDVAIEARIAANGLASVSLTPIHLVPLVEAGLMG